MSLIVMTDDGVAFDGASPERGPLGGAESAFLSLAEAFAGAGHQVEVRNRCAAPLVRNGVTWAPLASEVPDRADLYIANRGHRLIGLVRRARARVFWLHNPGGYLKKPRYVLPLLRWRPTLVVAGRHHRTTVPSWMPGGRAVIPHGLDPIFRDERAERPPPPPRAIFTSNPLRGLDWLLDLWTRAVRPAVPAAELHVYAGAAVYGAVKTGHAARMEAVLARARALAAEGVVWHAPLPRAGVAAALTAARVMLYRGDPGETFCMALAEAQALGLPAVVQPIGAVAERVVDGVTGAVAADEATFAAAAIALLRDDRLWLARHRAALALQKGLSWDEVAARFLALAS